MNDAKTIVILGGGVGGVVAATSLRNKLDEQHRVAIVDRERDHVFAPSFLWLMTGQRTARNISRPLNRLAKKGIEVICGDIEQIDPETHRVRVVDQTSGDDLLGGTDQDPRAHSLVVSLGAELAPDTVPGLVEAGRGW